MASSNGDAGYGNGVVRVEAEELLHLPLPIEMAPGVMDPRGERKESIFRFRLYFDRVFF